MTRASQKTEEREIVENLFCGIFHSNATGLVVEPRDEPEPDILVHGVRLAEIAGAGVTSLYVEVTEYHPIASGEDFQRSQVDAFWQEKLQPTILAARQSNPALKNIQAEINFKIQEVFKTQKDLKKFWLPARKYHESIVRDLLRAIEMTIPRILPGRSLEVSFQPKETLSKIPIYLGNMTCLAKEDFPAADKHIDLIRLSFSHLEWPPWWCPRMTGGWNCPSADQFLQILEDKLEKAKKYHTQGRPLWLLIVADLHNDLESYVCPHGHEELRFLREQIDATGFDFASSPFQQVWLYSEFSRGALRLYATPSRAQSVPPSR